MSSFQSLSWSQMAILSTLLHRGLWRQGEGHTQQDCPSYPTQGRCAPAGEQAHGTSMCVPCVCVTCVCLCVPCGSMCVPWLSYRTRRGAGGVLVRVLVRCTLQRTATCPEVASGFKGVSVLRVLGCTKWIHVHLQICGHCSSLRNIIMWTVLQGNFWNLLLQPALPCPLHHLPSDQEDLCSFLILAC